MATWIERLRPPVSGRHPVLTDSLDECRNVVWSLMPKSFHDSRIGPWDDWSAGFVGAKQQHGQEQMGAAVVEREQRRPCQQAQFHAGVKAVAPGADIHPATGFGPEDR